MSSVGVVFILEYLGFSIVIINDNYIVTNASPKQQKEAFKSPPPTVVSPVTSPIASPSSSAVTAMPDDQTKLQMIVQFSEKSGMNQSYSRQ